MTIEDIKEYAKENEVEIKYFTNPSYDNSIIGISYDDRVIYDFEKMVEDLMEQDNISYEEATEFIEYNTLRALAYIGPDAPIILYTKK